MKRRETNCNIQTESLILSSKLTSKNFHQAVYAGFIDKIEYNVRDKGIPFHELETTLNSHGITLVPSKTKKGFAIYKATFPQHNEVTVFINYFTHLVTRVVINPSSTRSIIELYDVYKVIWKLLNLKKFNLYRIDLSIDMKRDFSDTLKGAKVKYKQHSEPYTTKSGKITGFYLGKGAERFLLYSRDLKNPREVDFPCSRVEVALTGLKKPAQTIEEIVEVLASDEWHRSDKNPFRKISLNSLIFCLNTSCTKTAYIQGALDHAPFVNVRAALNNKNRNFDRDYKNIFKHIPDKFQPAEIFRIAIQNYLKPLNYGETL